MGHFSPNLLECWFSNMHTPQRLGVDMCEENARTYVYSYSKVRNESLISMAPVLALSQCIF